MYEFKGVVTKVGDVQSFASGFTKRDLVVEEDRPGEWKNVVAFSFKKNNCSLLDTVKVGSRVKIGFAVDGRAWQDPRTGAVRYFNDLTALKLDVEGATEVPPPAAPAETPGESLDDGGLPF